MKLVLESDESAALESSNSAALAALLESSDADALLASSNAAALAALLDSSDSNHAPVESGDTTVAQDSTINDAPVDTLGLTYLSSDSNSEILMVNTNMVILT